MSMADQGADKRLELAYDAGQKALAAQDGTVGNLRTRANNLLATTALFTSFSTGIGLINTDPDRGAILATWKAFVLVGLLVLLGGCVLYVVWPIKKFQFVPSAQVIMQLYNQGRDEKYIRESITSAMITARIENQRKMKPRQTAFKAAVILLVSNIIVLVLFLSFWK